MRKKYLTKLIAVSLLVCLVMMFSGLGSFVASASEKVTLTAWLWGQFPVKIPKYTNPMFLAKHPNVKEIKFVVLADDALRKAIMVAVTTQTDLPDISASQDWDTTRYFMNGMAEDLTGLYPADDFMPYKIEVATYNGRIYGVPLDPSPAAMLYRTDIYANAGVDIGAIKTWQDLLDQGKKIRALPGDVYALNLPKEGIWYNIFEIMMHSYGTSIYDSHGNVIFDSPVNIKVIKMYKKLYDSLASDFGQTRQAGWATALKEGKLVSEIHACWYLGSAKLQAPEMAGKWRMTEHPVGPSGSQTFQGGTTFFVPKGSHNKILAVEYLMDFHKYGAVSLCKDGGIRVTYLPLLTDPYFSAPDPYYGGQAVEKFFLDQCGKIASGIVHYSPVWGQARDLISSGLAPFIAGKISAEEAAKSIAAQIRALK